jgi:hypothetical protein
MKKTAKWITLLALLLLVSSGNAFPANRELFRTGGKATLATVNGEPITLEDFDQALAALHGQTMETTAKPRSHPMELLDRLINARLFIQEARNIGLDELPEVIKEIKDYGEATQRQMLFSRHVQNIRKADKKEVEKIYRDSVKEIKIISVLIETEENAKKLDAEVKSGGDFHELAMRMINAGEAKGNIEGGYVKYGTLLPQVAEFVSNMKIGDTSPPIKIGKRFSMLMLQDVRMIEDPAAKDRAEMEALQAKKVAAIRAYINQLIKKYVKINKNLVDHLDYESSEPGFEKLRQDSRVVAEVKGETPVTIRDLTMAMERKYFHGAERAAQGKKLNIRKNEILEGILTNRVANKEAKRIKIDRSKAYKNNVEEFKKAILFGTFIRKVIEPDLKVGEEELKAYHQAHIGNYVFPERMRIGGLAFLKKEDAEDVMEKLRKGLDFQWARANAEGQADAKDAKDLLVFGESPEWTSSLPEGVQKAVSGAQRGEYRLYADPSGIYYVLNVLEVLPPEPLPFEMARDRIAEDMIKEKRENVVKDWTEKLKAASDVKILVSEQELEQLVKAQAK